MQEKGEQNFSNICNYQPMADRHDFVKQKTASLQPTFHNHFNQPSKGHIFGLIEM
jgi:hypothetical protein